MQEDESYDGNDLVGIVEEKDCGSEVASWGWIHRLFWEEVM